MNKCIIFDLDGTLIDSRADIADSVNLARQKCGLDELPFETIVSFVGNGMEKLAERAFAGTPADIKKAANLIQQCYRKNMVNKTVLYPGVSEGLHTLHKSAWKIGLISNKPEFFCKEILRHFNLEKLFCSIVGGDSGFPLKPAPDSINYILNISASAPENSWFAGDNWTDLDAAHNAKIKSCFLHYGFGNNDARYFDFEAENFHDLIFMLTGK